MIKINLLPIRELKKKESIRQQIVIFVFTIFLLVVGMGYFYIAQNRTLENNRKELERVKLDLKKYKKISVRIKALKKKEAILKKKLKIIKNLDKSQQTAVHILDAIATQLPKDRLWLTLLKTQGYKLTLKGYAFDNETIADYMKRLEATEVFKGVDLVSSINKRIHGRLMKEFIITATIVDVKK